MRSAGTRAVAQHVEAAKRLFAELEAHSIAATAAIGRENGESFFAAIDQRGRVVAELDSIMAELTADRGVLRSPENAAMVEDLALTAAAALSSHEALVGRARTERDRLGEALARVAQPDEVAHQYAATSPHLRFSIIG